MPHPECRILGPDDASTLSRVAEGVFDGTVVADWAQAFLSDPAHILAGAVEDGVLVGMVSSVRYLHPDKPPQLWINEVGVADSHQRRGIGRRLLQATLEEARRRGCVEAWVASDTGEVPLAFYRALGGEEQGGHTHFTWPLGGH